MDRIGSWELSKRFGMEHRVLQRAVRNAMKSLLKIDIIIEPSGNNGRRAAPIKEYLLTEKQWIEVCRYLRECEGNRGIKDFFLA